MTGFFLLQKAPFPTLCKKTYEILLTLDVRKPTLSISKQNIVPNDNANLFCVLFNFDGFNI